MFNKHKKKEEPITPVEVTRTMSNNYVMKMIPGIKTTMVNTLHDRDYADIEFGIEVAKSGINGTLLPKGARIVVPCEQRWWEYGSAIQLLLGHFGINDHKALSPDLNILDVGSGWSGLGPALNIAWNCNVTEYEPVDQYINDRAGTQNILRGHGYKGLDVQKVDLVDMPDTQFDAVFCISVLEHVAKENEKQCWKNLADRVRPGGLFFMTTDVVENPLQPHKYDELRIMPNYTTADMEARVNMLIQEHNMATVGIPDYTYNGDKVFDFTFFRAALYKEKIWTKSVH